MNSGPTAERVYDAIKRKILERDFGPGERLDPAKLGDELHSSVTPVRDALHMLIGEHLVETRTSDGFHLPALDAPGLQDLYAWNNEILKLALRQTRGGTLDPRPDKSMTSRPSIDRLFDHIGNTSANIEHHRCIVSLNDRLAAVRRFESHVLPNVEQEEDILAALVAADDSHGLSRAITAYHHRRSAVAPQAVRLLYRGA